MTSGTSSFSLRLEGEDDCFFLIPFSVRVVV